MTQGQRLREARKNMGYKLDDLSKLTGICSTQLGRYENGKRFPSFEQIILLSFYLEVSLYYLINRGDIHYDSLKLLERVT